MADVISGRGTGVIDSARRRVATRTSELAPPLSRFERRLAPYHGWLALALYALAAVVTERHAVVHLGSVISGNGPSDPTQYMWAMWWFPHAILHGLNPFITHAIWVSNNYNLASVTSTPLPAVVMAPITWLAGSVNGPIVGYNVANLLAPVISAWFAYRLCYRLTGAPWSAILGGWLYGFSSYFFAVLQGHLHLAFTFMPPILGLLAVGYLQGDFGARRVVLLSGLTVLCQMLCGTELLFTGVLLGGLGLIIAFMLAPSQLRPRIVGLSVALLAGGVLAAIVGSPFLYYAFTGPEAQAGQAATYPADLLSFVIPTPDTWVGGHRFIQVSSKFLGDTAEQGTYLGLPLILIVAASWRSLYRRRVIRLLMVMTLIIFVLSLGVSLTIAGHGTFSLPFKRLADSRLFNQVLPVRLGVYIAFATSVSAAMWLASAKGRHWRRWLLAIVAVVVLFPNANGYRINGQAIYDLGYQSPAFITDGLYKQVLTPGEVILPIPWGPNGSPLLWQAQAHGYFTEASGWFGYFPPNYNDSPITGELAGFSGFTDSRAQMRTFLLAHHVGAVVIADGQGASWPQLFTQLGFAARHIGGVTVFRVPSGLRS